MNRRFGLSLVLLCLLAMVPGCESWSRQEKGLAIGAGTGAGIGALIGAASGSWAWGALIGAAGGALAGYVIADATEPKEPLPTGSEGARKQDQAYEYLRKANQARSQEDSEYYLRKSLDAYPTASAHNNLGLIYLQRGDRAAAESQWNSALVLDPDNKPARDNIAKMRAGD